MRIGIDARFVFPQMDGIGRYLINLIDSLSKNYKDFQDIHFYVLEVEEFSANSILRKFDDRNNITFIKIPVKPLTIKNHFLGKYIKPLKLDVFHYPQFDLPWFLSGMKIVTTIHDLNPQIFPNFFSTRFGFIKKYYSIILNWITLKKSNKILAISHSTKQELLDLFGGKYEDKIEVIWLGVNQSKINESDKILREKILKKIKYKFKFDKYFLYVGNNRPHKNIIRMLQAYSRLKENSLSQLKFILVGCRLQSNTDVNQIITDLNLRENVLYIEADDVELEALYSGAEVFIFCSLSEGFGLPILEAMSFGTPVITSNISSMKEIADGYALLVNPNSVEEILNAMNLICTDEPLREKFSTSGLIRAGEFTWQKCASRTLSVYSSMLNK